MREPQGAEGVRVQKVLSQAGIASRRVAERMIIDGRVEVDGRIVTELGTRVDPDNAVIRVDGARVMLDDALVHLALNKPLGMVSTMSDDQGRPCIGDIVEHRVRGNAIATHHESFSELARRSADRVTQLLELPTCVAARASWSRCCAARCRCCSLAASRSVR